MNPAGLTIGAVAAQAAVNVETIRYYQRRGLLSVPAALTGSVRRYSEDTVRRVRFIKRAQRLGFTLEEVADLLALNDGKHCAETRELAERKLTQLEGKLSDLKSMRDALVGLVRACRKASTKVACPIIETLGRAPGS